MSISSGRDVSIDEALDRAKRSLHMAYSGNTTSDYKSIIKQDLLDVSQRKMLAECGTGYAQLAIALQQERAWEEQQLQRIKETAVGN